MIEKKYKLLGFISLTNLTNWSIGQITYEDNIKYIFPSCKISKLIKRSKKQIVVEDLKRYNRITIKTNSKGVVIRDNEIGSNIKTKKQFTIQKGQLAISKIDARNGAIGIVPTEADKAIITGNFWAFDVNLKLVDINYLVFILSSKEFVKTWLACSNGGGNRLYLQERLFLDVVIPLPSIEVQHQIIIKYNTTMKEANKNEKIASELEESIDSELFKSLEIKESIKQDKGSSRLKFTSFVNLIKWGTAINLAQTNPRDMFISTKFENVPLINVAKINPSTQFSNRAIEEGNITFLPMECISDVYGQILYSREGEITKSKGYTRFAENDVLWAKITPCMENGKCSIATDLHNGFGYGSTEYHVVRTNERKLYNKYIYCFLRTKLIRKVAQDYFTGSAGQQRVGADFLKNLIIPLPPVRSKDPNAVTQETIANKIFDIKENIKNYHQRAAELKIQAKKDFEEAVFSEI